MDLSPPNVTIKFMSGKAVQVCHTRGMLSQFSGSTHLPSSGSYTNLLHVFKPQSKDTHKGFKNRRCLLQIPDGFVLSGGLVLFRLPSVQHESIVAHFGHGMAPSSSWLFVRF